MRTAVQRDIERILKNQFSFVDYLTLVQEIFPGMTVKSPDKHRKELTAFSSHISTYTHIGDYKSPAGENLLITAVELSGEKYVESSRSIQRRYAKKLIENGNYDAALIAFFTPNDPKWRFSYVRLDYDVQIKNGRLQSVENLTPAKRYSYLVGKDEPCHTAISRFYRFIADEGNHEKPSLYDLEDAFSVEKVTNEFFDLYCEKYHLLRERLEQDQSFLQEAQRCKFSSAQFAKKLLGQIIFLYFMQKKGWMGVLPWNQTLTKSEYLRTLSSQDNRIRRILPSVYSLAEDGMFHLNRNVLNVSSNEGKKALAGCLRGEAWGSGDRNFMRHIFNHCIEQGKNFYNDYLEPLFYATLNTDRRDTLYYSDIYECRIPFLSSDLFEPVSGYDWENTNFVIPNEVFSNVSTAGISADGILDVFDRYNFTICEDEPLEREVAIDPEMLGKVFENLLEVNDRKSKGAFYTPREIVHYMCQESIINHLAEHTDIHVDAIRNFVSFCDIITDSDIDAIVQKSGKLFIPSAILEYDTNGSCLNNRIEEIDKALESIKILDPAVGSGAFPMCMVNELVRIRQCLTEYLRVTMSATYRERLTAERTPYALKLHTIEHSIFAVDNDPSAIDIARLRLWLSLAIDAEDVNPLPLPNLESNIICGDSLFFTIGSLSNEISALINHADTVPSITQLLDRITDLKSQLFSCFDRNRKVALINAIADCKARLVSYTSKTRQHERYHFYLQNTANPSMPCLLWPLEFTDVFRKNRGFDIVIGNPPYIQLQKSISSTEKAGDKYSNLGYQTYTKTGDMYCLFYEMAIRLLCPNGHLAFISSNKWLKTAYGILLRGFLANNTDPKVLIDFSGTKVFDTAQVDVSILLLKRGTNNGSTSACIIDSVVSTSIADYVQQNAMLVSYKTSDIWGIVSNIDETIRDKISKVGKPLSKWNIKINYGIKTGFNKGFVISEEQKNELCLAESNSGELMRPVLKGRDINKWSFAYKNLWLITVHNGINESLPPIDIDKYRAVKEYLSSYYSELSKRSDQGRTPYHLRDCAYLESFSQPKIIFQEMVQSPSFAFDAKGQYMCLDTARIITGEHLEYLTALFNSNLFFYAVKHFYSGGGLGGSGVRMKHTFFIHFNAYVPSEEEEVFIRSVVLSDSSDKDNVINRFFYDKYDITENEVKHIENDICV